MDIIVCICENMYLCEKYACRPTCADFGDRRTDGQVVQSARGTQALT